jgi:hypothetical protein
LLISRSLSFERLCYDASQLKNGIAENRRPSLGVRRLGGIRDAHHH